MDTERELLTAWLAFARQVLNSEWWAEDEDMPEAQQLKRLEAATKTLLQRLEDDDG